MSLNSIRKQIRNSHTAPEARVLETLTADINFSATFHGKAQDRAVKLVHSIRNDSKPSLMEAFLAEYGLSTDEGIALMCLAEALLRVPDHETIDALIEDKIAPSEWSEHLGKSNSPLVNASTWALMLTGKILQDGQGIASILRGAVKRMGEPVIRIAVAQAMKELGEQFVLGETIEKAIKRGEKAREAGYTYSYDMLGEAAMTAADADEFFASYANAIKTLAPRCQSPDIKENPGISIKLSALHPRYEFTQSTRVMEELVPRALELAQMAKEAGMGLNIDAEEADRLDLSLDIIEAVLSAPSLKGWDGFGVVVQAYGKRASSTLDWLYQLASDHDRKIMVRLVKGAYWDTEIKRAQVEGLNDFPVFTQKQATDVSYLCCAKKLLDYSDRIYPQFATHNAHSVAAILEMNADFETYEFQRLHGMGEALHDTVLKSEKSRCRIYAPVGAHEDLLAYLVRRLLENGANSSFVNQIVDEDVPAEEIAANPFENLELTQSPISKPEALFLPERINAKGWDLHNGCDVEAIETARGKFKTHIWNFSRNEAAGDLVEVQNPADPTQLVGNIVYTSEAEVQKAIKNAKIWSVSAVKRAEVLSKAADLYEAHFGELFALLSREAGKTLNDAIAELREAVDFLRYYAVRGTETENSARGIITCISPWNFPLAIFTGQIAGALAAGNGVLAKPAETTSLTAIRAVELLHEAGVPETVLQLLPGEGSVIGRALTSDENINGVCFTGSTATAQSINKAMAQNLSPDAPLIAETGGLNAMIVDSTALPEQAVRDIIISAFQSAGQRCSALRVLYLQEDVKDSFLTMLFGAMDELRIGDPWKLSTDIGPAIDATAATKIMDHVSQAEAEGRLLKRVRVPNQGSFVSPSVIAVNGISDLQEEIFGPVLHVATFKADELEQTITAINATGYGLTFGMHSRIDDRITLATETVTAGNIYINRNQIGAVVGSQPFGGEGMSGTGPKAGGPDYVERFTKPERLIVAGSENEAIDTERLQSLIDTFEPTRAPLSAETFPGPTGESNRMTYHGRGVVLCLGPTKDAALNQAKIARQSGCHPICIAAGIDEETGFDGSLAPNTLRTLKRISAVVSYSEDKTLQKYRTALAERIGPIIPLCSEADLAKRLILERHVCLDTTAAGGNAQLLNQS